MPHRGPSYRKATQISLAVDRDFPCDLLVRSPAILERRIKCNDFFLKEITEKGICLYDASS
jgi:hypothetical protein